MDASSVWNFIESVLLSDAELVALVGSTPEDTRLQRSETSLPQYVDKYITYKGIISTETFKPVERHVYRFAGWARDEYENADVYCSQLINRIYDIFYLKSFDTADFRVVRVEAVSKDEDASFDKSKNLWRMNVQMAILLIRK